MLLNKEYTLFVGENAGGKIFFREKTLILGWMLIIFGMAFPYVTITKIAGSNLTVTLFTSMVGTWLIIFSSLSKFKSRNTSSIFVFLIFFVMVFFNSFFWLNYGLVPLLEISKNLFITLSYLFLFLVFKNSSISRKTYIFCQNVYLIFIFLNMIFGIIQFILSRFGIYLTFFWQSSGLRGVYFRLNGLMGEPAHLGLVSFGLLFLPVERKEEKFLLGFSAFVLLLSFSAVAWVVAIFLFIKFISNIKEKKYIFITILLICLFFPIIITHPGFSRIQSAFYLKDLSSFTRVSRGFLVFTNISMKKKITGIGPGYVEILSHLYSGKFYNRITSAGDYVNGLSSELINFGLIGAIILNIFFYKIIGGRKYFIIFLAFTLLRLGTSLNNASSFLLIVLLMIVVQKQTRLDKRYNYDTVK